MVTSAPPPPPPPPPGSPGNRPNRRPYRPRNRLEQRIVQVINAVYQAGTEPEPMGIARAMLTDPTFIGFVVVPGPERDRLLLRGVARIVYNVMRSLRFISGPHEGTKACHAVPVAGRKSGLLKFGPRMTRADWVAVRDAQDRRSVGHAISRDEANAIIDDLDNQGVDTLEDGYGPMAIGL